MSVKSILLKKCICFYLVWWWLRVVCLTLQVKPLQFPKSLLIQMIISAIQWPLKNKKSPEMLSYSNGNFRRWETPKSHHLKSIQIFLNHRIQTAVRFTCNHRKYQISLQLLHPIHPAKGFNAKAHRLWKHLLSRVRLISLNSKLKLS